MSLPLTALMQGLCPRGLLTQAAQGPTMQSHAVKLLTRPQGCMGSGRCHTTQAVPKMCELLFLA